MSNTSIALVTDSTCDIPPDYLERYGIIVQPHVLIWNGVEYRDRVTLSSEEFYRRIQSEGTLPTTAQASVHDFLSLFHSLQEQGYREVVVILLSGHFSGAMLSAQQAAQQSPIPVHVYDSRAVTAGLAWQVLAAARARERGASAQEMLAAADEVRRKVRLVIALDTLEYLHRGGRIGKAAWLAGSILQIKPLIRVNHETGIVEAYGVERTRQRVIEAMIKRFFKEVAGEGRLHVAVMHGMAEEEAQAIAARIRQEHPDAEVYVHLTGPILGLNTGPRALALGGYRE